MFVCSFVINVLIVLLLNIYVCLSVCSPFITACVLDLFSFLSHFVFKEKWNRLLVILYYTGYSQCTMCAAYFYAFQFQFFLVFCVCSTISLSLSLFISLSLSFSLSHVLCSTYISTTAAAPFYTHFLSLSLSLTHTHTHTFSVETKLFMVLVNIEAC